jgi:hypothetical protein
MALPPREIGGARVLRFAGDAGWPEVDESPADLGFVEPVTALAIVQYEGEPAYFVFWLHSNGTVADSWHETLDDAIEATAEDGEKLGWVEMPSG